MTTMVLLIRHAAHADVGKRLTGRLPGCPLSDAGQAQAERLAERLRLARIDVVQSSPRERARQTAEAIGRMSVDGRVEIHDALDEVDFGAWAGRDFDALADDPAWRRWNAERNLALTPAGDGMGDVQARVTAHIERLRERLPDGIAVMVSHAEVIRAAVLRYLGRPLDAWPSIDIAPASVTRITLNEGGAAVLSVNEAAA